MSTFTKFLKCLQSISVACLPLCYLASCGASQEKVNCIIKITNLDSIKLSQGGVWSGDKLNLTITSENELIIIDAVKSILNGGQSLNPEQWSFARIGESNNYSLLIEKGIITGDLNIELEYHEVSPEIKYHVNVLTEGVSSSVTELSPQYELNTILTCLNEALVVDEILSVTINKKPFTNFQFIYDNSQLIIDSKYIDGDIEISVKLSNKEFSITTETQEEITVTSSVTTIANRKDLITELSISKDKIYDYSINNIEVYIGDSETCLEDISFHIDESHFYKATLEVNHTYITDNIRIVVKLQQNEPGTYTIMFTDGYTEFVSKKKITDKGFISDKIILEDKTKKIDKIVATITNPDTEEKRELIEGTEFSFDYTDCIFMLSPYVKGNVTVSLYVHPVSDELTFENEDWTLLSYWAHCGWDHFSYTYNETEQSLLGRTRKLTMKDGEEYNVFIMDVKSEPIYDPHEGDYALLTFQFDRCYSPNGAPWINYFCKHLSAAGWSYGDSTVYSLFDSEQDGDFKYFSPDWLKQEARTVVRWINGEPWNVQFFPLGANDIDPDRETTLDEDQHHYKDSDCKAYYNVEDSAELLKRRNMGDTYWMPTSIVGSSGFVDIVQAIGIVNGKTKKTSYALTDEYLETDYSVVPCFCL